MQFNSIPFLFIFLPVTLFVTCSAPKALRGFTSVVLSLVFYGLAGGDKFWWPLLLAGMVVLSYGLNRVLVRHPKKWILTLGLTLLSGVLVFFKLWQGGKWLPAGMSFFLFQMAAYMIDIFRGKMSFNSSFLGYSEQILLFPKLLSGPLMDPEELQRQSHGRTISRETLRLGLMELILGLSLKVLLAGRLGGLFPQAAVVGYRNISTGFAWMALIAWAMQLYFDFHGYSLMAVGLGRLMGYELPRNFDNPYCARSVSEFYRRWHMTLGQWFREYLYIPLGGNRQGTGRTLINLAVVWLFTGLWHGVGGNYILWALIIYLCIVNERLWLGKYLKKSPVLGHVYTILAILISWVPFAVGQWKDLIYFFARMLGLMPGLVNPQDVVIWGREYWPILLAGGILLTPWPGKLCRKLEKCWLADVLCLILFWVVVYFIATSAQDPFLYFQY